MFRAFWVLVFIAAIATPVSANTLFTTFGADNSWSTSGWYVLGHTSTWYTGWAMRFTVDQDCRLDSIQVAARTTNSAADAHMSLLIYNGDAAGPTTLAENLGTVQAPFLTATLLSINSTTRPALQTGQYYWVAGLPATDHTSLTWASGMVGSPRLVSTNNGTTWFYTGGGGPSVAVLGTPEPCTAGLLAIGITSLLRRRVVACRA